MARQVIGVLLVTAGFLVLVSCTPVVPSADDPAGRDEPPATGPLVPGVYTGTLTCQIALTVGGTRDSWVDTGPWSVVVQPDGFTRAREGQGETTTLGQITETDTVTSVTALENGVQIEETIVQRFSCMDTCQYARDAECDEINFCAIGTDCRDCGQLVSNGTGSVTFRRSGSNGIELVLLVSTADTAGFVYLNKRCTATLTR